MNAVKAPFWLNKNSRSMQTIAELTSHFSGKGQIDWIGLRPARKQPLKSVQKATITAKGLIGDHRNKAGKRTITLIQKEHLKVIASLLQENTPIAAQRLRRNIVVSGISLLGLRNQTFQIGEAILRGTSLCAPCSRMETELGYGGYNAMRGHGGICAEVVQEGIIQLGDKVHLLINQQDSNIYPI